MGRRDLFEQAFYENLQETDECITIQVGKNGQHEIPENMIEGFSTPTTTTVSSE